MRVQRVLVLPAVALLTVAAGAASAQQPTPLFNGRDLEGWQQVGSGTTAMGPEGIVTGGGPGLIYNTR